MEDYQYCYMSVKDITNPCDYFFHNCQLSFFYDSSLIHLNQNEVGYCKQLSSQVYTSAAHFSRNVLQKNCVS